MIEQPGYGVEPWCLRESALNLEVLAQSESVFALSNGHIGWRGNLDEGAPSGLPGCYLNGVYELRPLPYAEAGYGYPESGQVMINVANGKLIRLLVDDQPFDVRYGRLVTHERVLDFRAGVLRRQALWSSPTDRTVRVSSTRLVSLVQRAVAAVEYRVEAVDHPVRLVIQSELVTNESLPAAGDDPRVSAVLESPWQSQEHACDGAWVGMAHRTRASGLLMATAMDHLVEGPDSTQVVSESYPDLGRVTVTVSLEPGQVVRLVKFVAYGWSSARDLPAVRDQVAAARTGARQLGWEGLLAEQRSYLDDFWDRADVEVEGDTRIQQAARFALFHVLQAGARAEGRAIPAKGLTGPGYNGHTFWDAESFVLPMLTYTTPAAARHVLEWRHSTLPLARQRAGQLGLAGAAFPWRTITGAECSSYWPAGTAAFHIGADIADAVVHYLDATDDTVFEQEVGVDLLTHTARLWRSLGHHDAAGRFRIDGVTGPDEYSAVADNNVYTNLMAQHNLRAAAAAAARHPQQARRLGVDAEEMAAWRDAAGAMVIPYDRRLGVHPQAEGFTGHEVWDFSATTAEQYPLLLHFPYFDLYRKQVVKQADLVLAMHLRGEAFTAEQKAANFAYYERLTVRDSSLSACTQAVLAAEVGALDLAYDYLTEAALIDLDDLERNARDGLHVASLAGTWIALVAGLGGMRARDGSLRFAPRLPAGLTRLGFSLVFRGRRLRVDVGPHATRYQLRAGEPLTFHHFDTATTVSSPDPLVCPTPPLPTPTPALSALAQPPGRAPRHRGPASGPGRAETPGAPEAPEVSS